MWVETRRVSFVAPEVLYCFLGATACAVLWSFCQKTPGFVSHADPHSISVAMKILQKSSVLSEWNIFLLAGIIIFAKLQYFLRNNFLLILLLSLRSSQIYSCFKRVTKMKTRRSWWWCENWNSKEWWRRSVCQQNDDHKWEGLTGNVFTLLMKCLRQHSTKCWGLDPWVNEKWFSCILLS